MRRAWVCPPRSLLAKNYRAGGTTTIGVASHTAEGCSKEQTLILRCRDCL